MQKPDSSTPKKLIGVATQKVLTALNRADEIGGEVRDWIQEKVVIDPRYVGARKRLAKLLGKEYRSASEAREHEVAAEASRAAEAAPVVAVTPPSQRPLGDAGVKAQVYGKKSCPWSGRAITLLERHKVDFDYANLEEPDHEHLIPRLMSETGQRTTPWIYLRGQFIGGFNALAEIERLGQLEFALMTAEERKAAPAHIRNIVITPRPEHDEVAPAENAEPRPPVE